MSKDISAFIFSDRGESNSMIQEDYISFSYCEPSNFFNNEVYIGSQIENLEVFSIAMGIDLKVIQEGGLFIRRFGGNILVLVVEQ